MLAAEFERSAIEQPADDARVCRYMGFTQLYSLLSSRKLALVRMDQLKDRFEGGIPKGSLIFNADKQYSYVSEEEKQSLDRYDLCWADAAMSVQHFHEMRRWHYVSCWRLGERESEAMWRIYCPATAGVAINLSYAKLRQSLPNDPCIAIGKLRYHNFSQPTDVQGYLSVLMLKRDNFTHEEEVRIVKRDPETPPFPFDTSVIRRARAKGVRAEFIDWNPSDHVDSIVFSPYIENWEQDLVIDVVKRFAPSLANRVVESEMRGDPFPPELLYED